MKNPLRIDGDQLEQDDVALYRRLTRDVCYLYHELSAYRHVMGDLDYANDYPLEYWLLINRIDTGQSGDRFIRGGILILILAMLQDAFDGSGNYVSRYVNDISQELKQFIPEDDSMLRLAETVEHGLTLLATTSTADDSFRTDATWAYNAFVRKYFAERGT